MNGIAQITCGVFNVINHLPAIVSVSKYGGYRPFLTLVIYPGIVGGVLMSIPGFVTAKSVLCTKRLFNATLALSIFVGTVLDMEYAMLSYFHHNHFDVFSFFNCAGFVQLIINSAGVIANIGYICEPHTRESIGLYIYVIHNPVTSPSAAYRKEGMNEESDGNYCDIKAISNTSAPKPQPGMNFEPTVSAPQSMDIERQVPPSDDPGRKYKKTMLGIGCSEITIGVVVITLGITVGVIQPTVVETQHAIEFPYNSSDRCKDTYTPFGRDASTTYPGTWSGFVMVLLGILAIVTRNKASKSSYIANIAVGIVTGFAVLIGFVLSVIASFEFTYHCKIVYLALHASIAILCFIFTIIAVSHATFCGRKMDSGRRRGMRRRVDLGIDEETVAAVGAAAECCAACLAICECLAIFA